MYLNGRAIKKLRGRGHNNYIRAHDVPLRDEDVKLLQMGRNVLVVRAPGAGEWQYLDVGLYEVTE